MRKLSLIGFIVSLLILSLVGCSTMPDKLQVCYDTNGDQQCDDGSGSVGDDYLVIDGQKTRIYVKNID
jgi:hypothetical protein